MAGIDVLTYVSGRHRYILTGEGILGYHFFDSYDDALGELKRIRTLKEDYERLRATRDEAIFAEEKTGSLPDGYTLFILRIGGEVIAAIVMGPANYFARSGDLAKLLRDAWAHSKKPMKKASSMDPAPGGPSRI